MSLFSRLTRFDQEPRIVEWAQRGFARIFLLGLFTLILAEIYPVDYFKGRNTWAQIMVAASLCALAGKYRKQVLALTTLFALLLAPDWYPSNWLMEVARNEGLVEAIDIHALHHLMMAAVLGFSALAIVAQRKFPDRWPSRWPVLSLMLLYFGLLTIGDMRILVGYPRVALYAFVNAFGAYVWFLAYALRDCDPRDRSPLWFELATFHPFFSGTWLPIGLGAANLRNLEARDSRQLAVCQLKGIKLLLDCMLLGLLYRAIPWFHETLNIPVFDAIQQQHSYSRLQCWESLLCTFFEQCVAAAFLGNMLVASARMGGFLLLQQTYKPLRSRSINEFWNRISYYFKQTMVDLFFYPAFLNYFKSRPRWRWLFAISMAAGMGNILYHFRQFVNLAAANGLVDTLLGLKVYLVYCAVLCMGLWLSHSSRRDPGRIRVFFQILLFYSVLHIFDQERGSLTARLQFIQYLLGL